MRTRAALLAVLLSAVIVPVAVAAQKPTASTGGAASVTSSSAVLKGTVNPQGAETAYYFQYGPSTAYGSSTPAVSAGSGTTNVAVAETVSGLAGNTTYHYRIVAVNSVGTTVGSDHSFTTAKIPLSLQIAVAPNPVLFGGTAVVEGTLAGTGNANREVVLQANPFPYTAGFAQILNPELTNASGGFSFAVLGATIATQYRVVTTTKPTVISPVAVEAVAVRVSAHVRRARGSHRVRVYGTVAPAVNGAAVAIEKIGRHHRYVTVGGTVLRPATTGSSRFSKVVRVRRSGVYRVLVQLPAGGAYASNYSAPIVFR